MSENAIAGADSRDTLIYVAEMLEQLHRLSARDEFLAYLIGMAQVEALDAVRQAAAAEAVIASSRSARSRPELSGR